MSSFCSSTRRMAGEGEPSWARATDQVVFSRADANGRHTRWLVAGNGVGEFQLTDGGAAAGAGNGDRQPAFSPDGAHVVAESRKKPPMPMLGHVTSSYMSPNVGRSIAMALLRDGRSRMGERVSLKLMDGRTVGATVADPVFYDKEGARARG